VSQEILFLTLDRIFKRGGRQMLTLRNTIWRDRVGSQIEFKKLLYSGFLCDKAAAQPCSFDEAIGWPWSVLHAGIAPSRPRRGAKRELLRSCQLISQRHMSATFNYCFGRRPLSRALSVSLSSKLGGERIHH
jgi:hypothetical protein